MAHGKEAARDLRYGRRGGHWVPDGAEPTVFDNAPACSVCHLPMLCGQPGRHWSCSPTCEGCHKQVGPKGENCDCAKGASARPRKTRRARKALG